MISRINILLLCFVAAVVAAGIYIVNMPQVHTFSYLALGDSYTAGSYVKPQGRYADRAVHHLRKEDIDIADPEFIASPGWTTTMLTHGIEQHGHGKNYSVVTLLIGTNNLYGYGGVDVYTKEFEGILKHAITFAGGKAAHVIIISLPDLSVTPYVRDADKSDVAAQVALFNQTNRALAVRYGCQYLDIAPGTRERESKPEYLAPDGMHPNAREYAEWGRELAEVMKRVILIP